MSEQVYGLESGQDYFIPEVVQQILAAVEVAKKDGLKVEPGAFGVYCPIRTGVWADSAPHVCAIGAYLRGKPMDCKVVKIPTQTIFAAELLQVETSYIQGFIDAFDEVAATNNFDGCCEPQYRIGYHDGGKVRTLLIPDS
jgi:hypothetical protein